MNLFLVLLVYGATGYGAPVINQSHEIEMPAAECRKAADHINKAPLDKNQWAVCLEHK